MTTTSQISLNHLEVFQSSRNLNYFTRQFLRHRACIGVIRYGRWAEEAASDSGSTEDDPAPPLCSAFAASGLFPSVESLETASSARIRQGWRMLPVECVSCGARAVLDRASTVEKWQQITQILKSIHRDGCEHANFFNSSLDSYSSSEQGMHYILLLFVLFLFIWLGELDLFQFTVNNGIGIHFNVL